MTLAVGNVAGGDGDLSNALLAAAGIGLAAIGAALVGYRLLPRGVGQGLFVTALSGLLLINYTFNAEPRDADWTLRAGACLTSLSLLWLIVAAWVERAPGDSPGPELRRHVAQQATVVFALLAGGVIVAEMRGAAGEELPLTSLLLLLLVVAGGGWLRGERNLAGYGVLGLLLTVLWLAVPPLWLTGRKTFVAGVILLAAAVSLAIVLGGVLLDWRRRARVPMAEPQLLLQPPARHRRAYALALVLCVGVGAGAVLVGSSLLTPLALGLAALAVLGVGHRWRSNAIGELGLVLMAGVVVSAGAAWLPGGVAGEVLGWTLASLWLQWLARFWHQQLDEGRPWTSAGRLIPLARRLSYVAAAGAFVWVVSWVVPGLRGTLAGGWAAIPCALLLLLLASMLVRDARRQGSGVAALGAVLAATGGVVALQQFVVGRGWTLPWSLWIAFATMLIAVRTRSPQRDTPVEATFNAFIGGVAPMAALGGLVLERFWLEPVGVVVVTIACAAGALAVRFLPLRMPAAANVAS